MKKLLTLTLIMLLAFSLTSCGRESIKSEPSDSNPNVITSLVPSSQPTATAATASDDAATATESSGKLSIEETPLLVEESLCVTATRVGMHDDDYALELKIENKSEYDISFQVIHASVNNMMVGGYLSTTVHANSTNIELVTLDTKDMLVNGTEYIMEIGVQFYFGIVDGQTDYTTEHYMIKTSAYGEHEQPKMDTGVEVYNQGGVRVLATYAISEDYWEYNKINLYIENDSDRDVFVGGDYMINDAIEDNFSSYYVSAGKTGINPVKVVMPDDVETLTALAISLYTADGKTLEDTPQVAYVSVPLN